MEKIVNYNGLTVNVSNVLMGKRCEFLINNSIYYFLNNEIVSCQNADLVINKLSKEYIHNISETACENKWIKVINYCAKNNYQNYFPVKVLLKNPEINRIVYVDSKGCVRGYEGLIEFPKEFIIKLPEYKSNEATLEEIIK